MKIISMAIKNVNHHPDNPRTKHDIESIMRSFDEFGILQPIVIWSKKNYVIVGNGRLEAATCLDLKVVPTVRADHLSEEQAIAYMIADNKVGDQSEFDWQKLSKLVTGLSEKGMDLAATGFKDYELEPLMEADWSPPAVGALPEVGGATTVKFSEEQWAVIEPALKRARSFDGWEKADDAVCIAGICEEYKG